MKKDRLDLLNTCITLVQSKHTYNTVEHLQKLLTIEFPNLMFTLDEVIEINMLSLDIQDTMLILKNAGYGR